MSATMARHVELLMSATMVRTRPARWNEPFWREHGRPVTHADRPAAANAMTTVQRIDQRKPTTLADLEAWLAKVDGALDNYAAETGQVFVGVPDEPTGRQYAETVSPWGDNADSRPGDARGDERIERRRRATELEREIIIARKRARGAAFADREHWNQELLRLSAELRQIREAERRERDAVRTPPAPLGPSVSRD